MEKGAKGASKASMANNNNSPQRRLLCKAMQGRCYMIIKDKSGQTMHKEK